MQLENPPDRQKAILKAVTKIKTQGWTSIKVELETNLEREDDLDDCYGYMMESLEQYGLTEQGVGYFTNHNEDYTSSWTVKGALSYLEVYNDGSVDTECTFTLSLKDPDNIFLLPKIVQVFVDMCNEYGNEFDTDGAGMHMALLNTSDYDPDRGLSHEDVAKFNNFKKSMAGLMPTLFFLGANSPASRGMNFRRPGVGYATHRAAIDWRGALEFRVFDTCYDKPEAILDNVVVMANCLKFWSDTYKDPNVDAKDVTFGNDNDFTLERLYVHIKHIDLLRYGLKHLKPSYYTIRQLKAQRGFKVTKRAIVSKRQQFIKDLDIAYKEYIERREWRKQALKHQNLADNLGGQRGEMTPEKMAKLEAKAEAAISLEPPTPKPTFVKEQVHEYDYKLNGQYRLA